MKPEPGVHNGTMQIEMSQTTKTIKYAGGIKTEDVNTEMTAGSSMKEIY